MRRVFLILSLLLLITGLGSSASLAQSKLDASIFSYDGKEFVRIGRKTLLHRANDSFWSRLPSQLRTAHE
jgi:hypothetical protein